MQMVKYAREPADAEKSAKARGSDLRVSFKNMRETCLMLKGMKLAAAQQYLKDVLAMKRCVVFRRFCGGIGRTAQAKNEGSSNGQGRWPKKCAEALLGLLENAKSNAEVRRETLERVAIERVTAISIDWRARMRRMSENYAMHILR